MKNLWNRIRSPVHVIAWLLGPALMFCAVLWAGLFWHMAAVAGVFAVVFVSVALGELTKTLERLECRVCGSDLVKREDPQ